MNEINWIQKGWECPKCGAVMAPHISCCVNCRGNNGGNTAITIASPAITIVDPISVEANWTGDKLLITPSSTCDLKENAEEQWERYYLNV